MRSIGSCRPMTPVDETRTSSASMPSAARHPGGEGRAVAVALRAGRHVGVLGHGDDGAGPTVGDVAPAEQRPTAPANRLWVNSPAAVQGASEAMIEKSRVASLTPDVGDVGAEAERVGSGGRGAHLRHSRRDGRPDRPSAPDRRPGRPAHSSGPVRGGCSDRAADGMLHSSIRKCTIRWSPGTPGLLRVLAPDQATTRTSSAGAGAGATASPTTGPRTPNDPRPLREQGARAGPFGT